MAPYDSRASGSPDTLAKRFDGNWRDNLPIEAFIVESWSQGFMVGALLIMAGITVSNMRRGVLLHKLILLEVCDLGVRCASQS